MQYVVIIEGDDAAETCEGVEQLIREAIPFHLEGMTEAGDPIPPATSRAIMVDVSIPVAA